MGIDIIIVHNIFTMTLNLPLTTALIQYIKNYPNKKFISWTHDPSFNNDKKKRSFNNKEIEKLIYKQHKNVKYVGISNYLKESLINELGFNKNSITVIPNGIDIINFLDLEPETIEIINKRHILEHDLIIFYPGKIIKYKNIDICLNILNEIKNKGKNPLLIISAGRLPHTNNHEYFDEIINLIAQLNIQKNVILLEDEIIANKINISFEIIKDFYKISDLVINLSSFENFGLPLIEAGAYKVPLIINDLSVFKEIVENDNYFIDINSDSVERIASKIISSLEHNPQSQLFNKVRSHYNLSNIFIDKIQPLINQLYGTIK